MFDSKNMLKPEKQHNCLLYDYRNIGHYLILFKANSNKTKQQKIKHGNNDYSLFEFLFGFKL